MNNHELKTKLLEFTINGVNSFLEANPELVFYAFAFDCNTEECAEVLLCFNTEKEFSKTLEEYQKGRFSHLYKKEEEVFDLKFNTGDWEYQDVDDISLMTRKEIDTIYNSIPSADFNEWENFTESLMQLFCETLVEFRKTETYNRIPKTKDFISFCIDHDEDFEPAMKRLKKYE